MKKHFSELHDTVIAQGLCARCGVCAGICPAGVIDFNAEYFPVLKGECISCGFCSRCCPGADVNFPALSRAVNDTRYDPGDLEGYTENNFVGHPLDNEVRYAGASGGLVTGLLTYLLETGKIDGAVVVGPDPDHPYRTKGVLATTVEDIKKAAQSKYCVTPSMEVLQKIRKKKGKFAIVALPCQIHGLRKIAEVDPKLSGKIACIFGLYCTCTMNPEGHLEAMQAAGVKKEDVARFDFRGGGWPGGMHVVNKNKSTTALHVQEAFGTVINVMFRLFGAKRCYLCIDGLAEYADLSFGDFWAFDYPDEYSKLERCTLVSQRTPQGLKILRDAEADGAVILHHLPGKRVSKRILAMVQAKRTRARVYFRARKRKNQLVPDYHFPIPDATFHDKKKNVSYALLGKFRGPLGRKIIMAILFSPIGSFLHKLNRKRQKTFSDYHDN